MTESLYEFIISIEYAGIFLAMALFPAESVMPLAGLAAAAGHVSLPLAITVGSLGSLVGSTVIYLIARQVPARSINRVVRRHGRWLGLTTGHIDQAGRWFDRHGRTAVFLGRFVPGVRTAVSIPAGLRRMPVGSFMFYTGLGSLIDISLLACVGFYGASSL